MRRTGPTNIWLRLLASRLIKYSNIYKCKAWRRVATDLLKPSRQRIAVNLSLIERNTTGGLTVIVPGSVLGSGRLSKPVKIAAYRFSATAKRKILEAGGQALTLDELLEQNPKGKGVIILR
ncbi:MAG TPA: 50S ribosomal protein L18e [bacterium]|nr:50S ribosomal protein L18e [bacterium]